jgi:hypothetical protein
MIRYNSTEKFQITRLTDVAHSSEDKYHREHGNTQAYLALLETQAETEIADMKSAFKQYYAIAVKYEHDILDDYVRKLEEHYAEFPGKDDLVASGAELLKIRQAKDYANWDANRKRKLQIIERKWEARIKDVRDMHREEMEGMDTRLKSNQDVKVHPPGMASLVLDI